MATSESQKQLLSLIRNFASEKSLSERRVSNLKKRSIELRSNLDAANADLELAKQSREVAEQELRGSQVQALMTDASIQAQQARISLLQAEISKAGSDVDALKNEEGAERDDFYNRMCDLNLMIRQFQNAVTQTTQKQQMQQLSSDDGQKICDIEEALNVQCILKGLEDKIKCLDAHLLDLEAEYYDELLDRDKVNEELANIKTREDVVSKIMEEVKLLQELRGQIIELEKVNGSLAQDLQKKLVCPDCGSNNIVD